MIGKIVEGMYSGGKYEEFESMKYMVGKDILNGVMKGVRIGGIKRGKMNRIVSSIKGV